MIVWLVALALAAQPSTGAPGPAVFDHEHAALGRFLAGAVDARGVDYAALGQRRSVLDGYLEDVASAPVDTFDDAQRLALYVNAYNAHTLAMVLDAGPPASIKDLDDGNPWDARRFSVGGRALTLNQMEHEHARKLADGRVHAVISCASKGCPPLPAEPLVAARANAQLDAASRRWAATNAFEIRGSQVLLSRIFEWYADDFTSSRQGDIPNVEGPAEAALWFLVNHVEPEVAARLTSGALTPAWQPYDWSLNAAPPREPDYP